MGEFLCSDELRGRIVDLEYIELTEDKIRQIYFEETGKELKVDIQLYHSNNYNKKLTIGSNGFDGTIIHFFNKELGVNQVYSIARGSEMKEEENWRPEDWMYNTFGIFVGQNNGQFQDAQRFEQYVNYDIIQKTKNSKINLTKIGLGHSLGGNTKQLQQLLNPEFDKVYTINAAQPTVYQLAYIDVKFRRKLMDRFNINLVNFNEIYTIDPKALVQFAEQYYQDAGNNIHRLVAEEDLLLAVGQNIRGFVFVGHGDPIDTMKDFVSIGNILGEIPDKDVQAIQMFLAKHATHYNNEGFDGAVKAMSGIDLKLVEKFLENEGLGDYAKDVIDIDNWKTGIPMVKDMSKKIPELLTHLSVIHRNLDPILGAFVKHGYMNHSQKKDVFNAVEGIEKDLQAIMQAIDEFSSTNSHPAIKSYQFIQLFKTIKNKMNSISKHLEVIQISFGDLMDAINKSVHGHSIYNLLQALAAEKGKEYKGKDLIVTVTSNGQKVKINLSSAARIYTKGMAIYDEKEDILRRMKVSFEHAYLNDFDKRKAELIEKITDMETSPGKYQHLVGNSTYGAYYVNVIRSITVHEVIPPLPQSFLAVFEEMFHYYEQDIQQGRQKMEKIKKTIEDYFEFDHQLAQSIEIG